MSQYGELTALTAQAVADLRAKQYHFTRLTGAGLCNVASHSAGAATTLFGVLQNKPNSGQAATLAYFGETKVVAGGALTVNTRITTNGSGRAAAAASGDNVHGLVLEAAVNDGDVVMALIHAPYPLTA